MKTWNYSDELPKAITTTKHLGCKVITLNYGAKENDEPGSENANQRYMYGSVRLAPGVADYGSIVAALVNNEFDRDKMQAIINNFLLDGDDQEVVEEFDQMQAFRRFAKRIARQFVNGEITEETAVSMWDEINQPNNQ